MSDGPRLEVAEVFRQFAEEYLTKYGASPEQRRVLRDVQNCRTAVLGGHVEQCDQCGHQKIAYNSCRNRHCPKCQGPARARWMQAREAELLPVPYFHVVFTLPEALGPLALQNKTVVYDVLFRAVGETLLEVAANPKRLGARIGFLAVLHTWGQNLMHHPHVHCVVPAGGLSANGEAWVPGREGFFLPVRVLSRVFRGKFIAFLKQAIGRGALEYHGSLTPLADPAAMEHLLDQVVRYDWVVYAKRPFGGPETVLKYLARYTHRVAISNRRLLHLENGQVTFSWKDYAHGNRQSTMTLAAVEFMRRFLLHVLPSSFVKIRYYGFMANRHRSENLARCRVLLVQTSAAMDQGSPEETKPTAEVLEDTPTFRCPACQKGTMRIIQRLERQREPLATFRPPSPLAIPPPDTS
jgi:Putative transposase/Transposase zinc-binding domain